MKVTEQMVVDACDAQEPGWDRFDRSLWWSVLNGLRAALGDQASPTIYPPDPPMEPPHDPEDERKEAPNER